MAWSLEALERRFPTIHWREPVAIDLLGMRDCHYACRVCIASKPLHGFDVPKLPTDEEEVIQHITEVHLPEGVDARAPAPLSTPPKRKGRFA